MAGGLLAGCEAVEGVQVCLVTVVATSIFHLAVRFSGNSRSLTTLTVSSPSGRCAPMRLKIATICMTFALGC